MFAPAAPAVVKKTKGNKVVLKRDKKKDSVNTTPKSKSNRKTFEDGMAPGGAEELDMTPPSSARSTPTKSPPKEPGTPPLPRRKKYSGSIQEDDEEFDYKEWWMSCFPDAFKNLMPTR